MEDLSTLLANVVWCLSWQRAKVSRGSVLSGLFPLGHGVGAGRSNPTLYVQVETLKWMGTFKQENQGKAYTTGAVVPTMPLLLRTDKAHTGFVLLIFKDFSVLYIQKSTHQRTSQ